MQQSSSNVGVERAELFISFQSREKSPPGSILKAKDLLRAPRGFIPTGPVRRDWLVCDCQM